MHIHILGICGTLMGSIALLAKELGHTVSGSDENVYPPMSDQLLAAGISLSSGYTAANIPTDVDLIIIGNAGLPRGNEAIEYVLDKGIEYTSGAEWLGRYLLGNRWVIAVAGTHGKTTTTSMVAFILEFAGMSPGFLIGGIPGNFPDSARLGDTPFFVIEADEYDTSYFDRRSKFLHYHPRTLILNNLEYDHADIFADLAAIQYQFHLLLRSIPGSGLIVHARNDKNLQTVFEKGCWTPKLPIGGETGSGLTARLIKSDASHFEVLFDDKPVGEVHWAMTGQHNVDNALAAIGASRHVGVEPGIACEALSGFLGVKRRMEIIYDSRGLRVYDDFAHHPTAIKTTLAGLRASVDAEKILAVIEPRSHTMRKGTHRDTLQSAARDADNVIWFKPEKMDWAMEENLHNDHTAILSDLDAIHDLIIAHIKDGTRHVVIMSNGAFGGLHLKLLATLSN